MNFSKQYIWGLLVDGFKSGESATVSSRCFNAVFGEASTFPHGRTRIRTVDSSRLWQLVDSDLRQTMCGRTQVLVVHFTTIADHLRQLGKV
ncbi:hypothetical protein Y032_0041g385 [Ancylostoma ceylanicum]|uniref:Uncharacterized protein n=1 Tax=Ancylostoma ceylanicum TaxID=53326 RepID=A0A016UHU4_9BILA|nr:hypothetical protein Y032_0041g385 [Ancylostoma ceylanicum]